MIKEDALSFFMTTSKSFWGKAAFTLLSSAVLTACSLTPSNLSASSPEAALTPLSAKIVTAQPLDEAIAPVSKLSSAHLSQERYKQAKVEHLSKKYRKPKAEVKPLVDLAWKYAEPELGISPELILGIMEKESSLRPGVHNSYGAVGLMQVVPRWHPDKVQRREQLFDPDFNVRVGVMVLKDFLRITKGDLNRALQRYSGNARRYATVVTSNSSKLEKLKDLEASTKEEPLYACMGSLVMDTAPSSPTFAFLNSPKSGKL